MKNATIFALLMFVATICNAQLLVSASTKVQGGVIGITNGLTPQIGFYESGSNTMEQTLIFSDAIITGENVFLTLDAETGGINFQNFCSILTSDRYAVLKLGHEVINIKSAVARSVDEWFANTDLNGQEIGKIELVLTKMAFNSRGANRTEESNWTDFSYEMTLNIYGKDDVLAQNITK